MSEEQDRTEAATPTDDELKAWMTIAERAARGVTNDADIVHDAASGAVAKVLKRIAEGRQPMADDGWRPFLRKVARNNAVGFIKAQQRVKPFGRGGSEPVAGFRERVDDMDMDEELRAERLRAELVAEAAASTLRVSDAVVRHDEAVALWGRLDPDEAWLLELRFVDGQPAKEVADALGITPAAVDQRVARAKRTLARLIEEARQR